MKENLQTETDKLKEMADKRLFGHLCKIIDDEKIVLEEFLSYQAIHHFGLKHYLDIIDNSRLPNHEKVKARKELARLAKYFWHR